MDQIAIAKFKATCLSLLERVRKTGEPILVTKRGKPIAQIFPPPPATNEKRSAYGCMKGTIEIAGDIVSPLPAEDWESLR
jgi:prevent-host-death family protein